MKTLMNINKSFEQKSVYSNLRKDIFTVLSGSLQLCARSIVKEFA